MLSDLTTQPGPSSRTNVIDFVHKSNLVAILISVAIIFLQTYMQSLSTTNTTAALQQQIQTVAETNANCIPLGAVKGISIEVTPTPSVSIRPTVNFVPRLSPTISN